MPQVEITASVSIKEAQADTERAGYLSLSVKDNFVNEYGAPKRIVVPANGEKIISVSDITSLRTVAIENMTEGSTVRLRLRTQDIANTDLVIGRFFLADVRNVDQIKFVNEGNAPVSLRVLLAGEPSEVA